ncbi:GDSL esterase/lipase 5-like isoform X2 [Neltuma alba]|uniref:GDSL esterase/lipase 5-like isoform X2 n=1 Tax=Neltuma alba TaxID=207710 RepID=UPI0010A2F50A|nr:GDSL esterase/lipase 5-like isoform X2 [Prosopis alba]
MGSLRVSVYFLRFYAMVSIQITISQSRMCIPEKQAALFILGDSLFDVGNNNYINTTTSAQANFEPYGGTFFRYPTGRFSDGRVIPDFVAEYAKLPLILPYLHPASYLDYIFGANFASAGSGALVETRQGTVTDLQTQASYFKRVSKLLKKKLGDRGAKAFLARSVYIINAGSNDYGAVLFTNSSTHAIPNPQGFVDIVIGNISSVIQEIYEEGGRKFGFSNVGPINCFPIARMLVNGSSLDACQEEAASAIARLHNRALPTMLQKLEKQLKGFKYSLTDFYSALVELMKYPSKYGFKEGDVACCGGGAYRGDNSCGGKRGIEDYELCDNVNEHVFFDSVHPTEASAQHFASLMWTGTGNFTHPYNLKQLFGI